MAKQLFANNAISLLAAGIADADLSLTVTAGHGARFPSPTAGDWFLATIFTYSGTSEVNHEVVKVTARSTDTFTIVRGQEGTTARSFSAGDPIQLRATAGSLERLRDGLANLSGVTDATTARSNLALGTAATHAHGDYATAAQGALANTALQPDALVTSEQVVINCDGGTTAALAASAIEIKSATGNADGKRWAWMPVKNSTLDEMRLYAIKDDGTLGSLFLTIQRSGHAYNRISFAGNVELQSGSLSVGDTGIFNGSVNSTNISAYQFGNNEITNLGTSLTGTPSWDFQASSTSSNRYSGTLTGNITPTITWPGFPCTIHLYLEQGGSGSYTITLPSACKWDDRLQPSDKLLSTAVGKKDRLTFDWDGTIAWTTLFKNPT